jgi:hypothetical protein
LLALVVLGHGLVGETFGGVNLIDIHLFPSLKRGPSGATAHSQALASSW